MPRPTPIKNHLSSIVLDPQWGLVRKRPRPERRRPPDYDEKFDFHTLAYDTFFDEETGLVRMFCPKLYNLEMVFKEARIEADGRPAGVQSIEKLKRHDVVSIDIPSGARSLSLSGDSWEYSVPIQRQALDVFEGKNCLLTMSRDNDLSWIRDWVQYHVKEHNAQAVLLFDNESSAYGIEDIEERLEGVEGLKTFAVIPTPFPHGAHGKRPFWEPPSKFLQGGILNLAARRFLGAARAVLSADIDELVWSKERRSVFDEVAASPLGYLRISGSWVFPAPDKDGPCRHRDHAFSDSQGREGREKWCVVPGGPLKGHYWDVHRIRGVWRQHLTSSTRCRYWHFSHTSTGWKAHRPKKPRGRFIPDPNLAAAMARAFPGTPKG